MYLVSLPLVKCDLGLPWPGNGQKRKEKQTTQNSPFLALEPYRASQRAARGRPVCPDPPGTPRSRAGCPFLASPPRPCLPVLAGVRGAGEGTGGA